MKNRQTGGFTLIELSITLVIIALVIGGVVVGKDMIEAANLRAQIKQIDRYKSAYNAFREKYGCLPGDCANPERFGFLPRYAYPAGNGIIGIQKNVPASTQNLTTGESGLFWRDLSDAGIITETLGENLLGVSPLFVDVPPGGLPKDQYLSPYVPRAEVGAASNYVFTMGRWRGPLSNPLTIPEGNYLFVSEVYSANAYDILPHGGITPSQASSIDSKMDDGMPQYGKVFAHTASRWASGWATGHTEGAYSPIDTDSSNIQGVGADGFTQTGLTTFSSHQYTCYDMKGQTNVRATYSTDYENGSRKNCALAFALD